MQTERRPCFVTLHTADALLDLVFTACTCLDRQILIREGLSGNVNNICTAGSEHLFHLLRMGEGADSRYIGFYMFFDFPGIFGIGAVRKEHARMRYRDGSHGLVGPRGDVDDVHIIVERHCKSHALVDVIAVVVHHGHLGTAHAYFNREVRTDRTANRLRYGNRKTHTVLQAAAPFVRAVVQAGGHELVQEPAVAAVNSDHTESLPLNKRCGIPERFDYLIDDLLRHFENMIEGLVISGGFVHGRRTVNFIQAARIHAAVVEFHRGDASVPGDGLCHCGKACP